MEVIRQTEGLQDKIIFDMLTLADSLKNLETSEFTVEAFVIYRKKADEDTIITFKIGEGQYYASASKTVIETVELAEEYRGGITGKKVELVKDKCAKGTYFNLRILD